MAEGDWRVTLELGTPDEAEATAEELRKRLSTEVDVTHDEATVHLWCNTGPEARRALEKAEDVAATTLALEWGVRRLGEQLELQTRAGVKKLVKGDFFPAYDADGGLLVALAPR